MSIFLAVTLAIVSASIFGFVARLLKQPLIIGYLFAGFGLAALGVIQQADRPLLESMAAFGITFLLFLVGLEMNLREIRTIGRVALLTGLGQIIFTLIFGYLIAGFLGFGSLASIYIAIALTFSSTIIVVKLLSEKRDLNSLYGKIAVGFLLVQDLVAILVLVFLAGFQKDTAAPIDFLWVAVKGIVLVAVVYFLSKMVLPRIFDRVATVSSELLFVASIAWAFLIASVVSRPEVGFSIEVGGFLAGLALADSSERLQIASRIRPLRDFFIVIFFFLLGVKMVVGVTPDLLLPAIVLSLFVLIGNPLIVLAIMGAIGHKRRTAFLASVTVAQISEFSFVVVAMGEKVGHITGSIVGLVALIGVITMTVSTYLIVNSQKIYRYLREILGIFERKKTKESAFIPEEEFSDHIVLIGADRTGKALLPVLRRREEQLLIIDFNPDVVERVASEGIQAMYGDIADSDALDLLGLPKARFVISTINSVDDNLSLLEKVKSIQGKKPVVVLVASMPADALRFYEAGADYVLVPKILSGEHLAHVIRAHGPDKRYFAKLRKRHFDRLARERF